MAKSKKKKFPPQTPVPQQQQGQTFLTELRASSGPLPPPEVLAGYDRIVPGAAERIISMAENQARHRQQIEKIAIESDSKDARLGLYFGLTIGLVAVIGGVTCIMSGHEVGGTIVGGTGLTGLVGVFVYGSTQRRKEREQRLKTQMATANPPNPKN